MSLLVNDHGVVRGDEEAELVVGEVDGDRQRVEDKMANVRANSSFVDVNLVLLPGDDNHVARLESGGVLLDLAAEHDDS